MRRGNAGNAERWDQGFITIYCWLFIITMNECSLGSLLLRSFLEPQFWRLNARDALTRPAPNLLPSSTSLPGLPDYRQISGGLTPSLLLNCEQVAAAGI